ncbi:MAG TPA: class I SAM-dependent methyltransferase [Candidatus Polarisedimenticolaceae bacterium]
MDQTRIWEHFQNEGADSFAGARPRLAWLASRLARGEQVLDIGVGDGAFERFAEARGARVHVLDPDAKAIARVREALDLGERARAGYATAIPWPDAAFDTVVVSEVLEHLDDATLEGSLAEIRRVLRPGGRILGTVPADEDLAAQAAVCPDCGKRFHRWGHARRFDRDGLGATLASRFASVDVSRRWFFAWERLNVRGKLQAAARLALATVGVWGSGHNFVFEARRD